MAEPGLTELRRGVLGPCVLALGKMPPRLGLELVRDLAAADGLLTSDGTVYPLLNRLRDAGLVTSEWRDDEGERARRYYFITEAGKRSLRRFPAPNGSSSPRPWQACCATPPPEQHQGKDRRRSAIPRSIIGWCGTTCASSMRPCEPAGRAGTRA